MGSTVAAGSRRWASGEQGVLPVLPHFQDHPFLKAEACESLATAGLPIQVCAASGCRPPNPRGPSRRTKPLCCPRLLLVYAATPANARRWLPSALPGPPACTDGWALPATSVGAAAGGRACSMEEAQRAAAVRELGRRQCRWRWSAAGQPEGTTRSPRGMACSAPFHCDRVGPPRLAPRRLARARAVKCFGGCPRTSPTSA